MLYIKIHCRSDFLRLMPYDKPSDKAVFPVVVRTYCEWRLGFGNIFVYGNDSHVAEMRII